MKQVTIKLDDELHKSAKIKAVMEDKIHHYRIVCGSNETKI